MTWYPKNQTAGLQGIAQSGLTNMPKPELPEVGDTILIASLPYGTQIIAEGSQVANGTDVI